MTFVNTSIKARNERVQRIYENWKNNQMKTIYLVISEQTGTIVYASLDSNKAHTKKHELYNEFKRIFYVTEIQAEE